jgi:hypothetical protein
MPRIGAVSFDVAGVCSIKKKFVGGCGTKEDALVSRSRIVGVCLSLALLLALATLSSDAAAFRIDGVEPEAGVTYPSQFPPEAFHFRISHFPPQLHTLSAFVEVMHQGKSLWLSPPIDVKRPAQGDSVFVTEIIPAGVFFVGGLDYSWVVRAFDAEGKRLAQSPRMAFRVENRAPSVHMQIISTDGDDLLNLREGDALLVTADVHDDEDEQLGFRTELAWWITEPGAKSAVRVGFGPELHYHFDTAGTYLLKAEATDKFGKVGSAQHRVVVGESSALSLESTACRCSVQRLPWGSTDAMEPSEPCPRQEDSLPREKVSVMVTSEAAGEEPVVLFPPCPQFFYVGDTLDFVAQPIEKTQSSEMIEAAYEMYWYADGVEVGRDSSYTHCLVREGDTEITLEVVDPHGRRASDTVYLVTILDRQPPQIRIVSPGDGSQVPLGSPVDLLAEVEDPEGPDRVLPLRWFVNGEPLAPGVASFVPQDEGIYVISVSGRDRAGNYGGANVSILASALQGISEESPDLSSVRIAGLKAPAVALAGHLYDLAVAIETAEEERIVVTWLLDGVPVDAGVLTGQGEVSMRLCFPHAGQFRLAVRAEDSRGNRREQAMQVLVVNPSGPTIVWPTSQSSSTLLLGNPVCFEAINVPADAQFEWVSDVDGLLAEGQATFEAELSPGRHEIALWVDDFVTTVEIIVEDAFRSLASESMATPCSGEVETDASVLAIEHEPISEAASHAPLVVRAQVPDDSAIQSASLFFRPEGTLEYYRLPMARFPGEYRATIPPGYMRPGGIEYYVEAADSQCQMVSYPAVDAARKPLHIEVSEDLSVPRAELLAPLGRVPSEGFAVSIGLSDAASNVDVRTARVYWNGQDVTARAEISEERIVYEVPPEEVQLTSELWIHIEDFAANRGEHRFRFIRAVDWQGRLEMRSESVKGFSAAFDAAGEWGPLGLRVHLDSNDPMFSPNDSQPGHEYEIDYEARLLRLGLGALSSHVAPLGLDSTYHRGIDMTAGLGPLSLQVVHGHPTHEVPGQTYARELVAVRPAFSTWPLNFALNVVKIRDEEQNVVGPDPEVNYVIDGQAGLGIPGTLAALEMEVALSLYHDNARGDLWAVIDTCREDPALDPASRDVLGWLDKIPSRARSFFQLPDPQYGVPSVDIGGEVGVRLPLPWSEFRVQGYRFGRDYHTIAGLGQTDAEGYRATFSTIRLFDAVHLELDYESSADGVASLLDMRSDKVVDERSSYTSYGTQLNLGRTGRANVDLRAKLTEEMPLGETEPAKRISSYALQLRNLTSRMGSVDLHFSVAAGLKRFDTLTDRNNEIGVLIKPRLAGSVGLTVWQPQLGSFTAHDLRAHSVMAVEQTRDSAGQVISWTSTLSALAESRLTSSTALGASCRSRYEYAQPLEMSASAFLRWRF